MIIPIANVPRDYAWGSTSAIADLLGTAPSGGPEAELWLGAHPGSPARVVGTDRTLLEATKGRLPFLLKVLAAAQPLSLQAHPTMEQAAEGFAREEASGVPLDAPERNYKDRFHKPEMIYALSDPFRALCGFRPVAETRALLVPVADDPRIAALLTRLVDDAALQATVEWLVGGDDEVRELVEALGDVSRARTSAARDALTWDVVARLAEIYPGDPGIAVSVLLHSVDLRPGEALYLPAGNIHAYIEGLGVELMAASDNVLRGGLTSKHVDVPELLRVLDVTPHPVPYLRASEPAPGVAVFAPEVPDFALTVLSDAALEDGVEVALRGPAIVLCTAGAATVADAPVERGGALFIEDEPSVRMRGTGRVFVATVGG